MMKWYYLACNVYDSVKSGRTTFVVVDSLQLE